MLDLLDRHIHSEYIVLLHLDYFLIEPADIDFITNACDLMNLDHEIDFIQLASNCGEKGFVHIIINLITSTNQVTSSSICKFVYGEDQVLLGFLLIHLTTTYPMKGVILLPVVS